MIFMKDDSCRRHRRCRQGHAVVVVTWLCCCTPVAHGSEDLLRLLDQVAHGRLERSLLYQVEAMPDDARINAALEAAFTSRGAKDEKQWIAVTLVRLGNKDDRYLQFLEGFARTAIEDRSPFFMKFDAGGRPVRGEMDAGFLKWCAANGKDPKSVGGIQYGAYAIDVLYLAEAQDPRARDLLREGLNSPDLMILPWVVQGLGRLQDTASIPVIEKRLQEMPKEARSAPAGELFWYPQAEARRTVQGSSRHTTH